MKFACNCPGCGQSNRFEWSQVGQPARCGHCGGAMTVPRPLSPPLEFDSRTNKVKFRCPACGRKYATKAEMAGRKIRCAGCGGGVRVPTPGLEDGSGSGPSVIRPKGPLTTFGANGGPFGLATTPQATVPAPPATRPVAPAMAKASSGGAAYGVLHDLDAGEKVELPRVEPVLPKRAEILTDSPGGDEDWESGDKPRKKKKKRKKKSGYFDTTETLQLVAGVVGFVGVVAFVAWRFPDFRFPLGGFLCVVGFIVYLMGAVQLRQLAAEEGFFPMIAYRFFPPYQWWFVLSRWSDTKDYFSFFVAGMITLSLGGVILKTSPQGRKADLAEMAFLRATGGHVDEDDPEEAIEEDEEEAPRPRARTAPPRIGARAPSAEAPLPGGPQPGAPHGGFVPQAPGLTPERQTDGLPQAPQPQNRRRFEE